MNPNEDAVYRCFTFLKSLPAMLPDGFSGFNFETILYDRDEWPLNLTETCSNFVRADDEASTLPPGLFGPSRVPDDDEETIDLPDDYLVNAPTNLQRFMTYAHNRISQNTVPQVSDRASESAHHLAAAPSFLSPVRGSDLMPVIAAAGLHRGANDRVVDLRADVPPQRRLGCARRAAHRTHRRTADAC